MVVSNTSPLVYLAALGDFALLPDLFSEVTIPRAVLEEITVGGAGLPVARAVEGALGSWLSVSDVGDLSRPDKLRQSGLHAGESEAIVLAAELHAPALLMDDGDGVRAAVFELVKRIARGILPGARRESMPSCCSSVLKSPNVVFPATSSAVPQALPALSNPG